ncbi:MAG: DNA polymerase ligase N-terminal domain-containing protein [Candidatus Aminicenantaceae bacterium]
MGLKEYREKRNFSKTQEPAPREIITVQKPAGLVYVIQRHRASHLHYDLRLEEKGILKSWAIPKTPPLEEGVKRLAVQTEDHPYEYKDFEGVIPDGEYGAGTVEIWDRGEYVPVESQTFKKIMKIKGEKLRGKYCLIKLNPKKIEDKNWLFFKLKNKE